MFRAQRKDHGGKGNGESKALSISSSHASLLFSLSGFLSLWCAVPHLVLGVDLGALLQQELRHTLVPIARRPMKWGDHVLRGDKGPPREARGEARAVRRRRRRRQRQRARQRKGAEEVSGKRRHRATIDSTHMYNSAGGRRGGREREKVNAQEVRACIREAAH